MKGHIERVLVLEDQSVMREFLMRAVKGAYPGVVVTEAATVSQAREAIDGQAYSLGLLDISLPDGSGIDLVGEMRKQQPECTLVMCTIFDDDEHLFSALRAGAHGYLLKEHPLDELVEQLRQILSGRPPLSPLIANRILDYFYQAGTETAAAPESDACHLTEREQEVLTLVAKGLTRNEVAQMLGISTHTVADYIKNIYRKLDVSSRAEAALEALRLGLIKS